MTQPTEIRRRPDGSIDTAHYMAIGRTRRGEAARTLAAQSAAKARRPLFSFAALLALLPFFGGNT